MVTAFRLNEWESIRYFFSRKFKGAMAKYLVTMAATVVFDLTVAILIGVTLGLLLLVARLAKVEINVEKVDMNRLGEKYLPFLPHFENSYVVYITGPLFFANAHRIEEIGAKVPFACDKVFLSMRGVSHLDISGAQTLLNLLKSFRERNLRVSLCGLSQSAGEMLRRAGILEIVGEGNVYWDVQKALLDRLDIA
jgi:SulP family sulfate permease